MPEPKLGDVMFYDGLYVLYTGKNNEYLFKGVVIRDDSGDDHIGRFADCWRRKTFVIKKMAISLEEIVDGE